MAENRELGYASYRAEQQAAQVTLYAEGETPSAGYTVVLEQSMLDVYPPQFVLYWTPPGGMAADMMTPFHVHTRFSAPDSVRVVTVHDADGVHEVPVK